MKKIIKLRDNHFYKKAGLRYSVGENGIYYVWYQAGPFNIVTGSGSSIKEAEIACKKRMIKENIEQTTNES